MAAGIAALGALLSGRQQGQQQADYLHAQLQRGQLEDELKRQALMEHLQASQRYEAARGKLPEDARGRLDLGETPDQIQKVTDRAAKAAAVADQLYQKAMDTSLPADQRMQAAMMSANLRAHPEVYDSLPDWMKISGIGEKLPTKPFHPFTVGNEVKAFEGYDASGKPIMESLGARPPSLAQSPTDKALDTPVGMLKGLNIITPTGEAWPNPMETVRQALSKGGLSISDKSRDALTQSQAATAGLDDILATGKDVLPDTPGSMSAYLNPLSMTVRGAAGDPKVARFTASKTSLINHLRAIANVSRVNQQELNQVNRALSDANSYPALEAAVNQARKALERARPNLIKAGKLEQPAPSSGGRVKLPSGMYYDPATGRAYTNP